MEINKATVKELYEAVRRLQEVVMIQRREIENLEVRINSLEKRFYLNLDSKRR